jgi:multidrug efflux system outer membrane protein
MEILRAKRRALDDVAWSHFQLHPLKGKYSRMMQRNVRFLFFYTLIISVISGCALYGPIYTKPKVNLPSQWNSTDQLSHIGQECLPLMAWWKGFNDPQLSALIEQAIKRNDLIQAAIGNIIAAQGQLIQIQFSWLPAVDALLLGYSSVNAALVVAGYSSGFIPTYAFNLFQFIRSNEWARANVAAARAARDAVILTIISQTAGSYFTYLGQNTLMKQQKQLVADLKALLTLSQMQYAQGLISLYTLQQYEQQYDKANADLPIIEHNVVVIRNALKLLLNENPGTIDIEYKFMHLKSNGIIPTNLPSQVLRNRPDVREAEQKLIAANANIGIATSTFFPSISLIGVGATNSPQLSHLFSGGTDYWNHQTFLTMPLLAPTVSGQIKQARGLYYAAYSNYIQTVRAAFKSVDNDLSAHQQYFKSLLAQTQNYASSKKAYDLAKVSYQQGLYSYPTLLMNKINLDNASIDLTKAKLAQLITIVQLYQDLGGGYAHQPRKS